MHAQNLIIFSTWFDPFHSLSKQLKYVIYAKGYIPSPLKVPYSKKWKCLCYKYPVISKNFKTFVFHTCINFNHIFDLLPKLLFHSFSKQLKYARRLHSLSAVTFFQYKVGYKMGLEHSLDLVCLRYRHPYFFHTLHTKFKFK